MKVLILSYDFRPNLGGVATVAHEVALSLQKDFGHEVTVLSIGANSQTLKSPDYEIIRYKSPRYALLSIVFCLYKLIQLRKHREFSVAIGLLWIPDGICLYVNNLLRKTKLPYLQYAHGVEILETDASMTKRLRSLLNPLKRLVMKNSDKVLCVSRFTQGQVIKYTGVSNTLVLNNGVNPELFKCLPADRNIPFTFVTVARLEDYKGIDYCLEACAQLKQLNIPFLYKVIGQGPDLSRLKSLKEKLKLNESVEFLGNLDQSEIVKILSSSSCFILLSRVDFRKPNVEGFGLVFLEAAACGIPSIAGNSGGVPDAVIDQETGLLVDPIDTAAIAASMRLMIENQSLYQKMRDKAFERARNELTWTNQVGKINEMVKNYVRN